MLAQFSSNAFYNGALGSGVEASERLAPKGIPWPSTLVPVAFVEVGSPEEAEGDSKSNAAEAQRVIRLVAQIIAAKELGYEDIGIVTPYTSQVRKLRMLFRTICPPNFDARRMEIASVDAFQGREKEIIIFSAVRSNPRGNVGFLGDWRRLNVMLTRARRGLVVFGTASTLRHDPYWEKWLRWCEENGAIHGGSLSLTASAESDASLALGRVPEDTQRGRGSQVQSQSSELTERPLVAPHNLPARPTSQGDWSGTRAQRRNENTGRPRQPSRTRPHAQFTDPVRSRSRSKSRPSKPLRRPSGFDQGPGHAPWMPPAQAAQIAGSPVAPAAQIAPSVPAAFQFRGHLLAANWVGPQQGHTQPQQKTAPSQVWSGSHTWGEAKETSWEVGAGGAGAQAYGSCGNVQASHGCSWSGNEAASLRAAPWMDPRRPWGHVGGWDPGCDPWVQARSPAGPQAALRPWAEAGSSWRDVQGGGTSSPSIGAWPDQGLGSQSDAGGPMRADVASPAAQRDGAPWADPGGRADEGAVAFTAEGGSWAGPGADCEQPAVASGLDGGFAAQPCREPSGAWGDPGGGPWTGPGARSWADQGGHSHVAPDTASVAAWGGVHPAGIQGSNGAMAHTGLQVADAALERAQMQYMAMLQNMGMVSPHPSRYPQLYA